MTTDLRWRPETGWERRCPECLRRHEAAWWPLDLEFWEPHTLVRCRACQTRKRVEAERQRRIADPVYRNKKVEELRRYRLENAEILRAKRHNLYMIRRQNPEWAAKMREKNRINMRLSRERKKLMNAAPYESERGNEKGGRTS